MDATPEILSALGFQELATISEVLSQARLSEKKDSPDATLAEQDQENSIESHDGIDPSESNDKQKLSTKDLLTTREENSQTDQIEDLQETPSIKSETDFKTEKEVHKPVRRKRPTETQLQPKSEKKLRERKVKQNPEENKPSVTPSNDYLFPCKSWTRTATPNTQPFQLQGNRASPIMESGVCSTALFQQTDSKNQQNQSPYPSIHSNMYNSQYPLGYNRMSYTNRPQTFINPSYSFAYNSNSLSGWPEQAMNFSNYSQLWQKDLSTHPFMRNGMQTNQVRPMSSIPFNAPNIPEAKRDIPSLAHPNSTPQYSASKFSQSPASCYLDTSFQPRTQQTLWSASTWSNMRDMQQQAQAHSNQGSLNSGVPPR